MFDQLWNDLRYAGRQLARSPAFTLVASLSVAVGISVAVSAFSVLNAVLLKPLPVPNADGVYHVYTSNFDDDDDDERWGPSSYADYEDFVRSGAFASLAAFANQGPATLIAGDRSPQSVELGFVSPNFFDALGVRLRAGRPFSSGGPAEQIVLAYRFWTRTFDGDASVIGSPVRVNGIEVTIAGVAPPEFIGVGVDSPVIGWVPAPLMPAMTGAASVLTDRNARQFWLVGRLAPGRAVESARARLTALAAALADQNPEAWRDTTRNQAHVVSIRTREQAMAPPTEVWLAIAAIAALVLFVVALACTNVAGLLLARAIGRRHEVAVRLTLGASRPRILQQLLTESVLLAAIGGTLGLLGTMWLVRFAGRFSSDMDALDLQPDWRVFAATAGFSLASALFFGLAPALQTLRVDLKSTLRSHSVAGERSRLRGALIAGQVAVSCLLILIAFNASRGARRYLNGDPGYNTAGLMSMHVTLTGFGNDTARQAAYLTELHDRLTAMPGVSSVTRGGLPWTPRRGGQGWQSINRVGVNYFETLQIPLLSGRSFTEADLRSSARVVVVSRELAKREGADPGKVISVGQGSSAEVIGIVEDVTRPGLHPMGVIYQLVGRNDATNFLTRVAPGTERTVATQLQEQLRDRYPEVVPPRAETIAEDLRGDTEDERITAGVALGVGAVELALATVGLYALLLYALFARAREIGVRVALGANPRAAVWTVMRDGLRYATIGALIGLVLGVPASILASNSFIGSSATDPVPFVAALVTVLIAAMLAAFLPARRAADIQPMANLRHE
jgi:predicted permease